MLLETNIHFSLNKFKNWEILSINSVFIRLGYKTSSKKIKIKIFNFSSYLWWLKNKILKIAHFEFILKKFYLNLFKIALFINYFKISFYF